MTFIFLSDSGGHFKPYRIAANTTTEGDATVCVVLSLSQKKKVEVAEDVPVFLR